LCGAHARLGTRLLKMWFVLSELFWMYLSLNVATPNTFANEFTKPVFVFTNMRLARSMPAVRRK